MEDGRWYFTVLTLKQMSEDHQKEAEKSVLKMIESHQYPRYAVIKEYGKEGTSPHINIVYYSITESYGKSFKQRIIRMVKKLDKMYYNGKISLTQKNISNEVQVANIVVGYLRKEEEAEILKVKGIEMEEMEKLREVKKFDKKEKCEKIMKCQMYDVVSNYYKVNYGQEEFNKKLFKKIIYEISRTKELSSNNCFNNIQQLYVSLYTQLNGREDVMSNYLDKLLYDFD